MNTIIIYSHYHDIKNDPKTLPSKKPLMHKQIFALPIKFLSRMTLPTHFNMTSNRIVLT